VIGLATEALVRIVFDGHGGAKTAERLGCGPSCATRKEECPDGSLWMVEDANPGSISSRGWREFSVVFGRGACVQFLPRSPLTLPRNVHW